MYYLILVAERAMQGAVVGLRDRQTARIDMCALCCSNAK